MRFKKFTEYCAGAGQDPLTCPAEVVVNFIALQKDRGLKYSTVMGYRSAIAWFRADSIGTASIVKRASKACFNIDPPIARYSQMWDADTLLSSIESLPAESQLSTMELGVKLVSLIAILSLNRQSSLAALGSSFQLVDGNVHLPILKLEKTSKPGNMRKEIILPRGSGASDLYNCLTSYIARTREARDYYSKAEGEEHGMLFISNLKPFQPVSPATLAKWLLRGLDGAGIDTATYKAHSTRCVANIL